MACSSQKRARKTDICFMALLFFSYALLLAARFVSGGGQLFFIVMLNVLYLMLVICYFSGVRTGVVVCCVFAAGYGGFLLYRAVFLHAVPSAWAYIWLAAVPLCSLALSFCRVGISGAGEGAGRGRTAETLSGFDETTSLPNERMFQYELGRYMAMAARGYIKVTLMFVRIGFPAGPHRPIGKEGLCELLRTVGEKISEVTRTEDAEYFVDGKGLYSLILITDLKGAAIVKERVARALRTVELHRGGDPFHLSLAVEVGMAEYNPNIRTSLDFREMALKDLELDS